MVTRAHLVVAAVAVDGLAALAGVTFVVPVLSPGRGPEATVEAVEVPDGPLVAADAPGVARDGARVLFEGAPFTGRLEATAGDGSRVVTDYVGGVRHGDERAWTADGRPVAHRVFRDGRREGLHTGWWPDGSIRSLARFAADRHDGQALRWHANGQLAQASSYVDGHEAGRQELWAADGTLRATYVVADGRRYGLVGAKPCATP